MTMTRTPATSFIESKSAETPPAPDTTVYSILAGKLFDSRKRRLLEDQVITVDKISGSILDVCDLDQYRSRYRSRCQDDAIDANTTSAGNSDSSLELEFISCRDLTFIPGFVDAHVHFFLHAYNETSANDQVTRESLVERTIRATVHARKTLMAGYTTVRDLGTEGALDADISLRKCLSGPKPIIPGPRYYCANRAIVTTGSYGPRSILYPSTNGVEGVMAAEVADGVDSCIRAVRKQIGVGADWIKIYADYRPRAAMNDVSPTISSRSLSTFNRKELEAMISTAHDLGVKTAAHANTAQAIEDVLDLGINSIEHGSELYSVEDNDVTLIRKLASATHVKWVPTLAAYYTIAQTGQKETWERAQITFKKALGENLDNIACGGDTGVFNHGENALEMILMRKLGAPWEKVLAWATLGGWECVRGMEWEGGWGQSQIEELEKRSGFHADKDRGRPFGYIHKGWAADLVGLEGNVTGSSEEFEESVKEGVRIVIKGGEVHKWLI